MKISALNIDFNGPIRDPLCLRSIKEGHFFKMRAYSVSDSS